MLHWYIKYSMDKLSVVSLNARALKNKMKRTALFSYLKQKKSDLEETHVTARDIVVWKKQWVCRIFFNECTNRCKGEVIWFQNTFQRN